MNRIDVYWITRLPVLQDWGEGVAVFCLVFLSVALAILAIYGITEELSFEYFVDFFRKIRRLVITFLTVFILSILLAILAPSYKDVALIYFVPKIEKDNFAQEVPGYIKEILDKIIDDKKGD